MSAVDTLAATGTLVASRLFIAGQWRPASDGGGIDLVDPATERIIGTVARATASDLDDALAGAARGFAVWRASTPEQRRSVLLGAAGLLRSRRASIAATITQEQGKAAAEALAEVEQAADYFDWYAGEAVRERGRDFTDAAGREIAITRRPVGPVAAFSAWNFPASLPARKIAPAIAAGCSIVVKPAEEAPGAARALVEALVDAGLPPEVVSLVTGDAPAIAEHLIGSDVIRKITITGSIPVGRTLVRLSAEHLQSLSLELGGHAPVVVLADADPVAAARALATAKFRNAGQVCISPTRFYVPRALASAFAAEFARVASALRIGAGSAEGTDVGPLANSRRLAAVEALVDDLRSRGARILTGGRRPPELDTGWFYEPTVVVDVPEDARILTEEPFGPVAPILPYDDLDEVVAAANSVEQALAAYVFGRDLDAAHALAARLDAGMIGVNSTALASPAAPFGGTKSSGYGREGGTEGIEEYTIASYTLTDAAPSSPTAASDGSSPSAAAASMPSSAPASDSASDTASDPRRIA